MSNLHTTAGPGANGQVEPTVATRDLRTRLMLKAPIGRTLVALQALGIAGGVPGWAVAAGRSAATPCCSVSSRSRNSN